MQQKKKPTQEPFLLPSISIHTIPNGGTIILGFSGGPDSLFLLHLLVTLKKQGRIKEVIAAHLNHEWQSHSQKDVHFCKQVAHENGVPFVSERLSSIASTIKWNGSKEELGRNARRLFLERIMHHYGANAIALAHHYDDQQETFFIRLVRGTSLTGLCGMQEKDGCYIRPLLHTRKEDILTYLHQNRMHYITDATNSSADYLRNRIRSKALPALRMCDKRFDDNSVKAMKRLQETEEYLISQTNTLFKTISRYEKKRLIIDFHELLAQPRIIQHRLLMHWLCKERVYFPVTERFFNEMIRFMRATKSSTHQICSTWAVVKEKNSDIYIKSTETRKRTPS